MSMIHCDECGVWFFAPEGRELHKNYCIGYNPAKNEGVIQKALKTARNGLRPKGVRK